MAVLTNGQKKEWAKQLFCEGEILQKAIAAKVGISERTIGIWIEKENWKLLKKSLLMTKQEQLANLYDQLTEINEAIKLKPKGERYADSKLADIRSKTTSDIKTLEVESNIGDVFEIGKHFVTFIQKIDFEGSKQVVDYYDAFIKDCLKTN